MSTYKVVEMPEGVKVVRQHKAGLSPSKKQQVTEMIGNFPVTDGLLELVAQLLKVKTMRGCEGALGRHFEAYRDVRACQWGLGFAHGVKGLPYSLDERYIGYDPTNKMEYVMLLSFCKVMGKSLSPYDFEKLNSYYQRLQQYAREFQGNEGQFKAALWEETPNDIKDMIFPYFQGLRAGEKQRGV